jgi:hypothetical protein
MEVLHLQPQPDELMSPRTMSPPLQDSLPDARPSSLQGARAIIIAVIIPMKGTFRLLLLAATLMPALVACGTPACTSATTAAVGLACTSNTGVLQFVDPDVFPNGTYPLGLYSQNTATVDGNALGVVAGGSLGYSGSFVLSPGNHTVIVLKTVYNSDGSKPTIGPTTFTETISTGQTTVLTY